ncbi:hypothetical protein EWM64_g9988 [Hericium alpestre]|uniref:Uncharacterized protein n=1 Tax=Hericium alpestre TaxID=135208 RepID=A0A4Y9ZHC2_9AGAM|nr:hypothetical protein EWM64_g9988 [Hericium alpestre]
MHPPTVGALNEVEDLPLRRALVQFPGSARPRVYCSCLITPGPPHAVYHQPVQLEVIGKLEDGGLCSLKQADCSQLFSAGRTTKCDHAECEQLGVRIANIRVVAPPTESADFGLWKQTARELMDIGWLSREECSTAALYTGDHSLDLHMFGPVFSITVRWPLHDSSHRSALPVFDARGVQLQPASVPDLLDQRRPGQCARVRFSIGSLPYSSGVPGKGLLAACLTDIHLL